MDDDACDGSEPTTPVPGYATSDWAGDSARRWARNAERLEAQLEPVADLLFASAPLHAGERVLDVGCGRGATTRRAAALVAPGGTAVGIDVAENLVAEARELASGVANIDWILADAQRHAFTGPPFDALISRFGVMFFDDATHAFANLRSGVRSGARLTMVVWQERDRSPLFEVPLRAGEATASRLGLVTEQLPVSGGPFSFGDAGTLRSTLLDAGWHDIEQDRVTLPLYSGGPGPVEQAVEVALEVGPLRLLLEHASDEQRNLVRDDLTRALEPYHDGTGVKLDGGVVVVRAIA